MVLEAGEKVHVIQRRLHKDDTRSHFVGVVDAFEKNLARISGYLYTIDANLNQFVKRDKLRVRVISVSANSVIVNVIPQTVEIEKIYYEYRIKGNTIVTDGVNWSLDVSHN